MIRFYANQAGYLPKGRKIAVLAQENRVDEMEKVQDKEVTLWNEKGEQTAVKQAVYAGVDESAEDKVWHIDFSDLTEEGTVTFQDGEGAVLGSCIISRKAYHTLNQTLCKALYFQRCGMALEETFAGKFRRCTCHTGTAVRLEDYLERKENAKQYEVTGGWHDAGDYGRYTTAAATALAHMIYAQQLFPESFTENLNIPESNDAMPDVLSECLYELRWLLKMQMEDGSVCHKLTSMRHANFVMPCEDKRQMILFPASTMAAAELYVTTGNAAYLDKLEDYLKTNENPTDMGWVDVSGLAGLSCLFGAKKKEGKETQRFQVCQQKFRQAFLNVADKICDIADVSGYFVALTKEEYGWGSNMVVLNRAMILAVAHLLTGEASYREMAQAQMDYILGVNATGYSYVTAVGTKSCQNPHNRVTVSDGIDETIPGFVVGGPNSAPVDEKAEWLITPDTPPMKCFLDVWECYSLNEITIYWNSPAIFVAAFLDADIV